MQLSKPRFPRNSPHSYNKSSRFLSLYYINPTVSSFGSESPVSHLVFIHLFNGYWNTRPPSNSGVDRSFTSHRFTSERNHNITIHISTHLFQTHELLIASTQTLVKLNRMRKKKTFIENFHVANRKDFSSSNRIQYRPSSNDISFAARAYGIEGTFFLLLIW